MSTQTFCTTAPCPVCDAFLVFPSSVVVSEVVNCRECGVSLEVKGQNPLELAEAPMEAEDWGQ